MATDHSVASVLALTVTTAALAQPAYCPRLDWLDRVGTDAQEAIVAVAESPLRPGMVVVGSTASAQFPTTLGTFAPIAFGADDVIVGELERFEPRFTWATYLGGSDDERATDVAINAAGRIAVVGITASADFPTTPGALDISYNSDRETHGDAFLSIFDPEGRLLYSTFIGGRKVDTATAVTWDGSGRVVVAGTTRSGNFPTTRGAFEEATVHESRDGFVLVIDPAGRDAEDLMYSTILRGPDAADDDIIRCVAVDHDGFIVVAGHTNSPAFPRTRGAFSIIAGGKTDGFVARLEPAGAGAADLRYGTYLGGRDGDLIHDVLIGTDGVLTIVGLTTSRDFPWRDPRTATIIGTDGFIVRLRLDGRGPEDLQYVEFLEGDGDESLDGLAFAPDGTQDPIVIGVAARSTPLPQDARTAADDADDRAAVERSVGTLTRVTEASGVIGRLVLAPQTRLDCFAPIRLDAVSRFTDLATRIDGTLLVIGSTEAAGTEEASSPPSDGLVARYFIDVPGCVGDLNEDRRVDRADLVVLLEQQGPCDACRADLDSDGVVGLRDAALLTTVWGACR